MHLKTYNEIKTDCSNRLITNPIEQHKLAIKILSIKIDNLEQQIKDFINYITTEEQYNRYLNNKEKQGD